MAVNTSTSLDETAWLACESVIRRFEDAWREHGRPDLALFLDGDSPHQTRLLVELVHVDLEFRLRAGEDARTEDYVGRFPELARKDLTLDLITSEFTLRNRHRPPAWPEEFWLRFPEHLSELRVLLPDEGRPGLTATRPAGGRYAPLTAVPSIPGYAIEDELGRGGMGVVYKARDLILNRTVAIKTLASVPRAENAARFAREYEAIARLDHPHIVPVYEVGEWRHGAGAAVPFFVMKWYAGGNLEAAPAGLKTDPKAHARTVETIARAVHHAHQRGILHRDLKPSNILLDESGRPHVADFGLAGRFDPLFSPALGGDSPAPASADRETLSGSVVGTPAYMAPEQARAPKQVTIAADVYGLGAILYHQLTGFSPFHGDTPLATLDLVASAPPIRPSAVNRAVPRDLETICLKCLEKDPSRRYASAAELADDLERWQSGRPIHARTTPAWEHAWRWVRRHPVVAGMGLTTLASLVTMVVVLATLNDRIQDRAQELSDAYKQECAKGYRLDDDLKRLQQELYLERVASAGRLYAANQLPHAWRLLDQCPENLREWEWRYLDSLRRSGADPTRGAGVCTLAEMGGGAGGLAVAPDGSRVVVGPRFQGTWIETETLVLDASTGQILHRLPGGPGVAFHPDSRRLATGRPGGGVILWDSVSGAELWNRPFPSPRNSQMVAGPGGRRLALSPDGSRVATWDLRGGLQVWTTDDGAPLATIDTGTAVISALAFSLDGARLVVATRDEVTAWDIATRARVSWGEPGRGAFAVALSSDGLQLATADLDGVVRLREPATGKTVRTCIGSPMQVNALVFSPGGNRLVSGGSDRTVRVWDVTSGAEVLSLPGVTGCVAEVAWNRVGDRIFALDTAVRVWQP